ncbi:hypothetical protein TEA_007934 [Camellia sinensis var. sinensis]|uniref:Transketolase-like pyrimidine-binding domain-containing protein n=1 Tax=Camellia sinensis var. sinensis TaxID=542762 RepID=A0A4S4EBB8_CAMSN|nr:hypothetical protein TEA_007934 [Camellia sinensis var. sinensis]
MGLINWCCFFFIGVVKFEPKSGKQLKTKSKTKSYTQYFAESLIAEAERDEKIVAIHAAMGGGTGLNLFQKRFPERCFDVGIAEQHAVTFAAGLATEGLKPFCTIYSSFLQRGYDQVAHDVDLQKLPVRFALDRAGLVGADGPTHCGAFDTTFMACLPNMVVMAPSCETELMHMVSTAAAIDDRPSCFRYPRGNGIGSILPPNNKGTPLESDVKTPKKSVESPPSQPQKSDIRGSDESKQMEGKEKSFESMDAKNEISVRKKAVAEEKGTDVVAGDGKRRSDERVNGDSGGGFMAGVAKKLGVSMNWGVVVLLAVIIVLYVKDWIQSGKKHEN